MPILFNINDQKMDIYDALSSNLFSVPASTNIEYTMGEAASPLKCVGPVAIHFI